MVEVDNSLLALIGRIHSTNTGSFQRCYDGQDADLELLEKLLANWKPTATERWVKFDECVKLLARIALAECEWYKA